MNLKEMTLACIPGTLALNGLKYSKLKIFENSSRILEKRFVYGMSFLFEISSYLALYPCLEKLFEGSFGDATSYLIGYAAGRIFGQSFIEEFVQDTDDDGNSDISTEPFFPQPPQKVYKKSSKNLEYLAA